VDALIPVVTPERGFEVRAEDSELASRLRVLEEPAVRVERFRPALLENDAAAVLTVQRAVDLPLEDEGGGDLLAGLGIFRVGGCGSRVTERGQCLVGRSTCVRLCRRQPPKTTASGIS
jgi:hypothetical protein